MHNDCSEILVGRQAGEGSYVIDASCRSVSRVHARIIRRGGSVYIEDLDSLNGTFVNGVRVRQKCVDVNDRITLGGVDGYCLNLVDVLGLFPLDDVEFSRRFMALRHVYEDYQSEVAALQTAGQESMMTKRMLPSLLTTGLTGILTLFVDDRAKIAVGVGAAVMGVIVFFASSKWAVASARDNRERLARLNEDFELNYVCPSCGASLRGRSWEFIYRRGCCPACNRKFNR